jgi:xanthine dehydrogenase accessory factor
MQWKIDTWQFIINNFHENLETVLLFVLESKGSSPGRYGFFMAINSVGDMMGSLGGGIMEHKFVELAKTRFSKADNTVSIHPQIHNKSADKNQSGMICSGEQTIFLYTLQTSDYDVVKNILNTYSQNLMCTLQITEKGLECLPNIFSSNYQFTQLNENQFIYKEKIGNTHHLYIIGGGHCALALSALMHSLGFYIHLFDEREGLNTMEKNHYVQEKKVIDDYAAIAPLIPSGENHYVVIMTLGYRTDAIALKAIINQSYKYIGVLGSGKKIEQLFNEFLLEGISQEKLQTVYAPIGLFIKSETPEEIAVSIAAQIIKIKNIPL